MFEKVRNTISEHNLLAVGDSVLVALSGGPDSVALVHLLSRLRKEMKLNLMAVYVNHRIRPRAAKEEEGFCRQLCDKLGLVLTIVREDIPALAQLKKKGLEETARDFRYTTFESLVVKYGCNKIALAHHVDDRVETILFRILRGTGRTGLQGIPIKRGRVVRPFYHVTKREIYSYLKRHRLKFCEDQSNARSDFARNYIRNKLLVDIRRRLSPGVDAALLNLSETAHEEEAFLEGVVQKAQKKIVRATIGGKIELDLKLFSGYNVWVRRRLLRYCLAKLSLDGRVPDRTVVDRLDEICMTAGKGLSLPDEVQAVKAGSKLLLYRGEGHAYIEGLEPGKTCQLPHLRLNFHCALPVTFDRSFEKTKRSRRVWLDWEKLSPPLVVRNIRRSDRFVPLGMKGTKKIGNYLTDRKVAGVYRDEIPVVCDQQGIVWLVGFEIADRVKIDTSTNKVVRIEITERRKSPAHAV
jgi:tRNA(Ile)-lysidine synthase